MTERLTADEERKAVAALEHAPFANLWADDPLDVLGVMVGDQAFWIPLRALAPTPEPAPAVPEGEQCEMCEGVGFTLGAAGVAGPEGPDDCGGCRGTGRVPTPEGEQADEEQRLRGLVAELRAEAAALAARDAAGYWEARRGKPGEWVVVLTQDGAVADVAYANDEGDARRTADRLNAERSPGQPEGEQAEDTYDYDNPGPDDENILSTPEGRAMVADAITEPAPGRPEGGQTNG